MSCIQVIVVQNITHMTITPYGAEYVNVMRPSDKVAPSHSLQKPNMEFPHVGFSGRYHHCSWWTHSSMTWVLHINVWGLNITIQLSLRGINYSTNIHNIHRRHLVTFPTLLNWFCYLIPILGRLVIPEYCYRFIYLRISIKYYIYNNTFGVKYKVRLVPYSTA